MTTRRWPWPRAATTAAGVVRLPAFSGGRDVELVLGLAWHTILGTDLRRAAWRRAREQRATHVVHAGGRSESVGTARLAGGRGPLRRELHAAAQLFATQAGPGAHALVWPMEADRFWVVQARDTRVLAGGDMVTDAPGARLAIAQFQQRFGGEGRVCGTLEGAGLAASAPAPTLDALAAGCGPGSLLQTRTRAWRSLALAPMLLAVPALAWQTQREEAPPAADALDAPMALAPDPELVRRDALTAALAAVSGPTVAGIAAVWQAVGDLALRPAGWRLHAVRCRHRGDAGWACEADYARAEALATAAGLTAHAAAGHWRWQGLDQATLQFDVSAPGRSLALADLHVVGAGVIADADALQALRPAFAQVLVGEAVAVPAPPGPDGLLAAPLLRQRDIRLRGPLRSLPLIDATLTERVVWHTLQVSFEPGARAGRDASVVMADLQGTSYEPAS
ncbi:type 4b pilus protein PilO2 [Achromobacter sp. GG226]|uniref:type 4b pilus protein PilO2 n=1 Tax=Verticiella alkaliphila TaxID=2779529 RepID=UPI001C0E4D46|nr:type 4b pilus protein PilO2 [Verticiella sp. GG226]MBU4611359.1 type 4b pilus protein PilO2 [Verticiella sp. GG226]